MAVERFEFTLMLPFRADINFSDARTARPEIDQLLTCGCCGWHKKSVRGDGVDTEANRALYAEYVYFHPFMQRLLFTEKYVSWHERSDVESMTVKIGHGADAAAIAFDVRLCELVVFDPDLLVLMLSVTLPESQKISVRDAQNTLDKVRRVYAPYFGKNRDGVDFGGHCADEVTITFSSGISPSTGIFSGVRADLAALPVMQANEERSPQSDDAVGRTLPIAAHWRALLAPLHMDGYGGSPSKSPYSLVQLGDDRAFVMAFIGMPDPRTFCDQQRGDVIRFGLIDDAGENKLPYSKQSLETFESEHCYDHFWYQGPTVDHSYKPSRIMMTAYSFVYFGDSTDTAFFVDQKAGALAHFRNAYRKLALVALVQRSMLLNGAWRLSSLQDDEQAADELGERVKGFYGAFLKFSQRFWFFEVSPQQQGQALFDRLQNHMQTKALYEEVRQELKDMVEFENLKESQRAAASSARLTRVASWLGGLGVTASLLGMNILKTDDANNVSVLGLPVTSWTANGITLTWVGLSLLLVGAVAWWAARSRQAAKQSEPKL